jgi:hypothetical protein
MDREGRNQDPGGSLVDREARVLDATRQIATAPEHEPADRQRGARAEREQEVRVAPRPRIAPAETPAQLAQQRLRTERERDERCGEEGEAGPEMQIVEPAVALREHGRAQRGPLDQPARREQHQRRDGVAVVERAAQAAGRHGSPRASGPRRRRDMTGVMPPTRRRAVA